MVKCCNIRSIIRNIFGFITRYYISIYSDPYGYPREHIMATVLNTKCQKAILVISDTNHYENGDLVTIQCFTERPMYMIIINYHN